MYLKDIHHDTEWQVLLPGQLITTNTTTLGASVNVSDSECYAFEFVMSSGTITDGTYTMVLQDSPDDVTFTAVADDFLLDADTPVVFVAADDNVIRSQGYNGHEPYVRAVIVSTGVTVGGSFILFALKQMHRHLPVPDQV